MTRIGIVAGEQSGDLLGAGLVNAFIKMKPDTIFEGIGGQHLQAAGVKIYYPVEKLAVMGVSEVFKHYFSLRRIRNDLCEYFLNNPPDVFIGVDAPDFNFWLEKKLRDKGIKTVHFISPSIWAWREYRVSSIRKCTDLMLTLFPFESDIYKKHNVCSKYVGHPLADQLPFLPDRNGANDELGLITGQINIGILPGSRTSEINKITPAFLQAAKKITKRFDHLQFITSLNNPGLEDQFNKIKSQIAEELPISVFVNQSHKVIEASDILLIASGTATLEAMIMNKPMVVGYKVNWLTYYLVRLLAKIPYVSLPNILSNKFIVPECLQNECNADRLSAELSAWITDKKRKEALEQSFTSITESLRMDANNVAAQAIIELLGTKNES